MPNKIKKILLLIIAILIMKTNINVKAVDVTGGGLSIGLNSACSSSYGYVACYSPKFQFRITLVKPDGKKVEGTNSVDFSYSTDGTKVSGKDGITANGHKVELINKEYKYAYVKDTDKDKNTDTEFKYIETYMVENPTYYQKKYTGIDDPNEYGNFIEEFSKYIKSNNQVYDVADDSENNNSNLKNCLEINDEKHQTDFLSLFAYYSGFTKNEDLTTKINIHYNDKIKKEISQNDYYLLIEPTYTIYYNTPTNLFEFNYVYGTASEIVKWIHQEATDNPYSYSKGYLTGLSLNFISQAGCNLYTPLENASGFTAITKDANCSINPSSDSLYSVLNRKYNIISRNQRLDYMQQVIDEEIGYGKYILRLKDDYSITPEEHTVGYKLNLCQDDDGILTSSITGIKKSDAEEGSTSKYIANDAFHISGDGISSTYCYDTVSYDFSQMIGSFENVQELTNIEIPDGKIVINRSCYFVSGASEETQAENYERYQDLNIELNVFGNKYDIKYKKSDDEISGERKKLFGKSKSGWVDYQITLTYGLENNKIMVKSNVDGEQNASIVFNAKIEDLFDNKSNGIINQMINNKNTISKQFDANNTIIYNLGYEDNADKNTDPLKCDFNFEVLDIGDDLGNLGAQFRIISLSNPFPARDGKSRIPGTNWLNEENNVYNYIINNRSIQYIDLPKKDLDGNNITKNETVTDPEMMYLSREPIYTVTLDPQTMLKIRKYNRNKDYTDINLTCDSNNRQCTSSFLRDNDIIPSSNLKGTCADKTEYNKVINEFGKENLLENIRKAVYVEAEDGIITYSKTNYNSIYDLNKNNRMDKEDIEIYENKEKNTIFYTCADKTYKSGG